MSNEENKVVEELMKEPIVEKPIVEENPINSDEESIPKSDKEEIHAIGLKKAIELKKEGWVVVEVLSAMPGREKTWVLRRG